jgi:hypothetical protein
MRLHGVLISLTETPCFVFSFYTSFLRVLSHVLRRWLSCTRAKLLGVEQLIFVVRRQGCRAGGANTARCPVGARP